MADASERRKKLEALASKRANETSAKPASPAKKPEAKHSSSSKPASKPKSNFPGKGRSLKDEVSDDDDDIIDDASDEVIESDTSEEFSDVDSDSDRPRSSSKRKSAPTKKSSRRSPPPKKKSRPSSSSSSSKSKPKKKNKGSDSDEESDNVSAASESEQSGGASGLTAVKECLDEKDQIDVVCFEQEKHLGGLWRYVEVTKENPNPHSSVYKSTIINTCKAMMTFSDYAIPEDWPMFLPNKKIAQYFDMYAEHFDLLPHIRFQTKVVEVKELHDSQNRWMVRYHQVPSAGTENATPDIKEEIFDYVMMCSGHHWKPRYPSFPGMNSEDPDGFTGQQMHSHYYRSVEDFKDKTAVVVGLGNSGSDLAAELSLNQTEVYLSCRRPAYVFPRWVLGVPLDTMRSRLLHMMPLFLVQYFTAMLFNIILPPRHKNMIPLRKPFESHPTINSILPERITTGMVKPVKNIKKLGPGKRVEFEDGTVVDNVDVIFYCTGYHVSFPVLKPDVVTDGKVGSGEDNQVWTWNYMVPPRHPNMAFIGLFQPVGAIMPIAELQCRFLVRTLVGKLDPLPSEERMDEEIRERREYLLKRYDDAPRHTIQVDYVPYCDQLAKRIGCFPSLGKLVQKYGVIEGLRLKMETIFGPPTPIQFRLVGPHAWEGARETTWGYAGKKAYRNSKYLQDTSNLTKNSKQAESTAL
ncbi:Cyclopentanone 1,2-monooxygenase (CPMO) [Mortierella sp. AM989]|nr:Cyclopentanone 1,2-monooxygenase (CPMO) [Mortierella sp. AM989]